MKFDPAKAWPHPVLRPSNYGDDYPDAEFEVEIELKRTESSTAVEVDAWFELSDPALLELVQQNKAQYALLVRSPQTHIRRTLMSKESRIRHSFPSGALSGRVEFSPFLVCLKELKQFRTENWHAEFADRKFDISPGEVLAEDVPKDYWIDTADEAPLGSIFGHKTNSNLPDGQWTYELAEDRVWIIMSDSDGRKYQEAREIADNQPESQYLMNGLYLPALIAILNDVDQDAAQFENYRWFDSLNKRLETVGSSPLGSDGETRLMDAQKVLDSPFPKMPIVADSGKDNL